MIDVLIGMNKVKYTTLKEINWLPKNTGTKEADLYIDLASIFSKLYIKNNMPDIINYNGDQVMAIVSGVLNVVAHYRKYIHSQGYDNKIYLIFNRRIPDYQSSIMSYGHIHFDRYSKSNIEYKTLNVIIDKAIELLHTLCDHVEDLYFPDTDGIEDYVATYHLIDPTRESLVISRYEEFFTIFPHYPITILIPRRDPKIIRRNTVIEEMLADCKYVSSGVEYEMISEIYAIIGLKNREISEVHGLKRVKTFKLLDKLIDKELISTNISAKQLFYTLSYGINDSVVQELYARYLMIDSKAAAAGLTQSQIKRIKHGMINLYDNNRLEALNNMVDKDHIIYFHDLYKNTVGGLKWSE